jgi:hypothetical protein
VAASQALVPHAPPQGHEHARSGRRPSRDRGAAGPPADGDSAPRRGQSRGIRVSPRARARGVGDAGGCLRDVVAPDARHRGFDVPRRAARV